MSYYGFRKVKTYQDETGKWNFSCDCYDSSIWSYENTRVWEHIDKWFKEGKTKEELEWYLFTNTLDGNFHGTTGKYNCLSWNNRHDKVVLSAEVKAELDELEKVKRELMYGEERKALENKLRANNIPYADWKNNFEYQELNARTSKACREYEDFRYNEYYKAWKEYLTQQNKNKKGNTYVVQLDFTKGSEVYKNVFVGGCGSRQVTFYFSMYKAKLFKKSIEEIKAMFCGNPSYSNIKIVNVSNHIKGTGKRKYAEVSSVEFNDLEKIAC